MANQSKLSQVDDHESEILELDPKLWENFPKEVLALMISKLPFSRVVAFRTVCKDWHTEVIPQAAPHVQASSKSTLLYFNWHRKYSNSKNGFAWWLQVHKAESEMQEFRQTTFPSPKDRESARLMHCEGGLLFFSFACALTKMMREIVVSNPLTGQTKSLCLPHPLLMRPLRYSNHFHRFLFGVVFDSGNTGSYGLVVAGVNETGHYETLVYKSAASSWKNGSPLLSTLSEAGRSVDEAEGAIQLQTDGRRSVSCNGNIYWYVTVNRSRTQESRHYILKFNFQEGTWKWIDERVIECGSSRGKCQITSLKGEILLWHLHREGYNESIFLMHGDVPARIHHLPRNLPCRYYLASELDPEVKSMPHSMIEGADKVITQIWKGGAYCIDYFAFSQQSVIYHVLVCLQDSHEWLHIVAHDTIEGSCTELPPLSKNELLDFLCYHPSNLWSFSASLTSVP